ncbi:hypothetical protein MKW92_040675 [Papaver armeniacum]|nr:hypothetical protein MKW92_040675 [Papaver armeniacum]
MGKKTYDSPKDSPRMEVGEIDTRAPFASVKAAVSLFGEAAFSGSGEKPVIKKSKLPPTERVLVKETQLHLAQKELNKFKEQLKNAETTKAQALNELEKAKRTVDDLTQKLKTINESKESAIKATEAARNQAKQLEEATAGNSLQSNAAWEHDLDSAREQYTLALSELNVAKQELTKIRQDYEVSMEAKAAAFKQAAEAENSAKANTERASEISKEISAAEESLVDVKHAAMQAQQERVNILSGKEAQRQSYGAALKEAENKLESFKKGFDPTLPGSLEAKLAETDAEVGALKKEMENAKASDLDSVKFVTLELDDAKESLQKVAEEENSLRSLVESCKTELEKVKKEHSELKEKEAVTESIAGSLHVQLRISKAELEAALAEETKAKDASDELVTTIQQLSLESENARTEAEQMKKNVEDLKKEAEETRHALEEAKKKLEIALNEAEEAKAAETKALGQIKVLSERTNAARASTSESGAKITLSTEEFESLNRKVEESDVLAEMKIAAAIAQVEAIKESEKEAQRKLETNWKEIEEIKVATEEATKRAEMAEMAKKAIEGELRRWREREQKRAAEAASRILAETEAASSPDSSPAPPFQPKLMKKQPSEKKSSPVNEKFQKAFSEKISKSRKFDKNNGSKKLLPSLSGIFHKKKNQVEGGSPSYLPGENPV